MKKLTVSEVIDLGTAKYTSTTRSEIPGAGCYYRLPNNPDRYCMVGMFFDEEKVYRMEEHVGEDIMESSLGITTLHLMLSEEGKSLADVFKDEVEHLAGSIDFWREVQDLHDSEKYWDEHGLSEKGHEKVKQIKEEYGK